MTIQLNHTIVPVHDRHASGRYYADVLGLPQPPTWGPFVVLELGNGVSLDFADDPNPIVARHYAFLVSDEEFDAIKARIDARGLRIWADPHRRHPDEINTNDGGRGLYWEDPDGHLLEIITVPYGGWPSS